MKKNHSLEIFNFQLDKAKRAPEKNLVEPNFGVDLLPCCLICAICSTFPLLRVNQLNERDDILIQTTKLAAL